jgi:adenylate cyclase class IV
MIEVEKKFILSESDIARLTKGAQFLQEKAFTDIYYDTEDFILTSKDKWLRSRAGKFELKLPLYRGGERLAYAYDELENDEDIKKALGFELDKLFVDSLADNMYSSFCICKTTRRKYKSGDFNIDLDTVEFREFIYSLGEIELMVGDKAEVGEATEKIMAFAEGKGLKIAPVRGKVIEYLKRIRPEHYQVMLRLGVVKEI